MTIVRAHHGEGPKGRRLRQAYPPRPAAHLRDAYTAIGPTGKPALTCLRRTRASSQPRLTTPMGTQTHPWQPKSTQGKPKPAQAHPSPPKATQAPPKGNSVPERRTKWEEVTIHYK